MNPLVSIIIPVFNAAETLERSVSSAFNQSYPNIEVICIDNNSIDDSWIKLMELKESFPSLILLKEKRPGAPFARNTGLESSKGEWVQFLDADDELAPNKIIVQLTEVDDKVGMISSGWKEESLTGDIINIKPEGDVWKDMFSGRIGNTCSLLFSKKYLVEVGAWDVTLKSSQERDLMFRILKIDGQVKYTEDILCTIYKQEGSITTSERNQLGNLERFVQLKARILDHLKTNVKEEWMKNIEFYRAGMFDWVFLLYSVNPILSLKYYKKFIGRSFSPKPSRFIGERYIKLYNFFGFRITQRMIQIKNWKR